MKVPFNDLAAQTAQLRPEIDAAIKRVLDSGYYVGGPEVETFETALAGYVGVRHAVGVANGTDAIALSLRALNIGAGHEVIAPAVSAYPTAVGIYQCGAQPVFVDVAGQTGLLAPNELRRSITPSTRAIILVHLYGNLAAEADLERLRQVAEEHRLPLIEDCAQALGARGIRSAAGRIGRIAAWSFYPTKNLGAIGDAGAVSTDDPELADRLRQLRNYGQKNRYEHVVLGFNSRLDPLQAAILAVKLGHLDRDNDKRRAIAEQYDEAFRELRFVKPVLVESPSGSNRHLYPVLTPSTQRPHFQSHLEARGVQTLVHYPIAMPDQEATPHDRRTLCPSARDFCRRVVSLPLYPALTSMQVKEVIEGVVEWDRNHRE